MSGTIYTGNNTKPVHGTFVSWLNSLIDTYTPGFYDSAISNLINLAFLKRNVMYIQELFAENGAGDPTYFITVIPTDTVDNILMVHTMDGLPIAYNDTDVFNIFEFTGGGIVSKFYENVIIPLYNTAGDKTHEIFVTFQDKYGIKCPMLRLKEFPSQEVIGYGILDMDFSGRYSGSYNVENNPFRKQSYIEIENKTNMVITAKIPILPKLATEYKIMAKGKIQIVLTPQTEYFVKNGIDLDSLKYRIHYIGPDETAPETE